MTDLYTNTKGVTIYVATGYNISSATTLEIHFSAPTGATGFVNSATASVSVLGANFTTSACGVFSANKTVKYVVNSGDFSGSAGHWKCWIQAEFGAAVRLVSSSFKFKVSKPG